MVDDTALLAELRARLQKLEDLEEIRQLYVDYGYHLDRLDFPAFAGLFARQAKLRLGPLRAQGRDEIERVMSEFNGGREPMSMVHVVGFQPRLQIDGDRATGEGMWLAVVRDPDDNPTVPLVGHFVDELVHEDGSWVFSARRSYLDIPTARAVLAAQASEPKSNRPQVG